MKDRPFSIVAVCLAGIFGLYVILPLISIVLLSFSARLELIPTEFTLRWYSFNLGMMLESLRTSFLIAGPAVVLALLITLPLSWALVREGVWGKGFLDQTIVLPMIIPQTVLGFILLQVFNSAGFREIPPLIVLILAHTLIIIPFMARPLIASLQQASRTLEEAAQTLGARRLRTFKDVTWPMITPGILVGVMLSFARSVNDFILTLFLIDPGYVPLSIQVYRSTQMGVPQLTAANSVLLLVVSVGTVFLAERFIDVDIRS